MYLCATDQLSPSSTAGYFVWSWWVTLGPELVPTATHLCLFCCAADIVFCDYSTEPARDGPVESLQARLAAVNTAARGSQPRLRAGPPLPEPQPCPSACPSPLTGALQLTGVLSPPGFPSHSLLFCPCPELLEAGWGYSSPQGRRTRPRSSPPKGCRWVPSCQVTTLMVCCCFF